MKNFRFYIFLIIIGLSSKINGQSERVFEVSINWSEVSYTANLITGEQAQRISFEDAAFDSSKELTPIFSRRFPVSSAGKLKVELVDYTLLGESPYQTIDVQAYENELSKQLNDQLNFYSTIDQNRREFFGKFSFNPILKTNTGIEFINYAKIKVTHLPQNQTITRSPFKTNSVLRDGDIYKLQINETGVYKLTGSYLSDQLGINLSNINPSNIQVFNNIGSYVARPIADERTDDLLELAILVVGGEDGSFDSNDAIYFYATGAEYWTTEEGEDEYSFKDNPYDVFNYAFLKIGNEQGKRITSSGTVSADLESVNIYLEKQRHEINATNILADDFSNLGSGTEWYGEFFDQIKVQDFSSNLNITDVVTGVPAKFTAQIAGRGFSSSVMQFQVNQESESVTIPAVSTNIYGSAFARVRRAVVETALTEDNPSLIVDYSQNSSAQGWLDYIEAQYMRNLTYSGSALRFGNTGLENQQAFSFTISNGSPTSVWEVTNYGDAYEVNSQTTGSNRYFDCPNTGIHRYVAFDRSAQLLQPIQGERISNQNIHSLADSDVVIITDEVFASSAERLAAHRAEQDGFSVTVLDIEQVYNEFSGGRIDPTAVRDLFKMLFDRDEDFRYGLLFGNGTYDYKGISFNRDEVNFVPVFETPNSLDPIFSFPSDDYFGLLSNHDGGSLEGEVDLAIGRIPVSDLSQANLVVDKIIKYETDLSIRGPWNMRSVFLADDEDTNLHINPADAISEDYLSDNPSINLEKLYFDSYTQVSTPGGERYPDVTEEINSNVFRGSLSFCYMGHGGPTGFAQERVLQIDDIDNWINGRSYPLFITATCSLASYDDPEVFSAGEKIVVNNNGGIALFTTSRAVYSNDNTRLTRSVHNFLLNKDENGENLTLGEILRQAKNSTKGDTVSVNARKFLLLGDPSMQLLYPTLDVVTSKINDQVVTPDSLTLTDTISALSRMKIEGFVANNGLIVDNYNGEIDVTVFDKRTTRRTLGQDSGSKEKDFKVQKNLIFKGKARVINGEFELEFIVPKDILFNIDQGKISYYATNGEIEAGGSFDQFLVGGSSSNSIEDDTPPVVEVFMNDENFVSGGITTSDPILLARINDDNGINLSGSSVGHDLTGILDDQSSESIYLNDFFETELNNFTKGSVRFPLLDLEEGVHKIEVRAWDIANNVGEGSTEFVVSNSQDGGLENVLNYPNPFTDNTCFTFEHNFAPDLMDIQIDVFTVSGKLVKTILHSTVVEGFRVADIKWDGKDDFGSQLGRGVYLYKVKVRAQSQNLVKESDFEKLVILK